MKTRLSKSFDRKIEVYQANESQSGGLSFDFVKSVWARVEDVKYQNESVIGQSNNLFNKKIVCRESNLDTNTNAFLIQGNIHQINKAETNHRKTQYAYFVTDNGFNLIKLFVDNFKNRVYIDKGIFEAEDCLINTLTAING